MAYPAGGRQCRATAQCRLEAQPRRYCFIGPAARPAASTASGPAPEGRGGRGESPLLADRAGRLDSAASRRDAYKSGQKKRKRRRRRRNKEKNNAGAQGGAGLSYRVDM